MFAIKRKIIAPLLAVLLAFTSVMPAVSYADRIDERPNAAEMTLDAVARPLMFVATVAGGALFIVTLPFSLLGRNTMEAGNVLVVQPFKSTFLRCLGCSQKNKG